MKRTTTNKLNMYLSVASVMSEFQSAWQPVPAFASAASRFSLNLDLLRAKLTEQSGATTGVRTEKRVKTNDLLERMLIIHKALMLYGNGSGNVLLEERNRETMTHLKMLTIPKLAVRCAELKGDLEFYGLHLADYGITSEMIDEILPMLNGIDQLNSSTRTAILKRKGITKAIEELERLLDKVLRFEMDALILPFKKNEPAFFNAFRGARVVVDYGHHGGRSPERDDGQVA